MCVVGRRLCCQLVKLTANSVTRSDLIGEVSCNTWSRRWFKISSGKKINFPAIIIVLSWWRQAAADDDNDALWISFRLVSRWCKNDESVPDNAVSTVARRFFWVEFRVDQVCLLFRVSTQSIGSFLKKNYFFYGWPFECEHRTEAWIKCIGVPRLRQKGASVREIFGLQYLWMIPWQI